MMANSYFFLLLNILISIRAALSYETSDLEDTATFHLDPASFYKPHNNSQNETERNAQYGYDGGPGTSDWAGECANGFSQSPIAFEPDTTTPALKEILKFSGENQIPLITNITNSGHSVKVKLTTSNPITVTGGALGDTLYEFQQLHFHWGDALYLGSEHTIGRKSFPLEVHFVFYKANVPDPTAVEDGIAVLGNVYELSITDNLVLDTITKNSKLIKPPGSFVVRSGGFPLSSYLPLDLYTYFYYKGSLTTPPCTEGVSWIWFPQIQPISPQQLREFQYIRDDLGLKVLYNYRETQPLNERSVLFVKSSL